MSSSLSSKKLRYAAGLSLLIAVVFIWRITLKDSQSTQHHSNPDTKGLIPGAPPVTKSEPTASGAVLQMKDGDRLTPAEARVLLSEALKIKNNAKSAEKAYFIIKKLCQSGFVNDAWDLIDINPSNFRDQEISAWFQYSGLSIPEVLEKAKLLSGNNETSQAGFGYLRSLRTEEMGAVLQNRSFGNLFSNSLFLSNTVAGELEFRAVSTANSDVRKEVLRAALLFHGQNLINDNGIAQVLRSLRELSATDKWQLLETHVKTDPEGLRREQVVKMTTEDADAALDTIVRTQSELANADITTAITRWGSLDPVKANLWFKENSSRLTEPQHDSAVTAFVDLALTYNEPDGALQWANQIRNTERRQAALARLQGGTEPDK